MLKHIVMWQFKDEAEGKTRSENCRHIRGLLESLVGVVPEILSLEVGINEYPSPQSSDMVLTVEFESKEALDRYTAHPEHVKVSTYVGKVRTSRSVVDYLI
ncbi:MAG: Dabb family protein [Spirochaetales bacterium]|nr:Dabb family protein [Spirochaetales bacterium]HNQ96558.1 Dabb family protein [Treponemataceae bacterium]